MINFPANTINCLIVEDEPLSQEILESYVENCPELKITGICADALQANQILNSKKIDLIFLDINMPILNGIDWLKTLDEIPEVIITTAYPEHAIEGFNLSVLDYLLKPFSFDRFLKAVNKFLSLKSRQMTLASEASGAEKIIMLKSSKKTYPVKLSEINYIESDGDYLKVQLTDRHIIIHDTLKNFILKLGSNDFFRVHRSYIVNVKMIEYIEGNQLCIASKMIPVATAYREGLQEIIRPSV